jgi:hypothetical protein
MLGLIFIKASSGGGGCPHWKYLDAIFDYWAALQPMGVRDATNAIADRHMA